jgi:hypothetical protein
LQTQIGIDEQKTQKNKAKKIQENQNSEFKNIQYKPKPQHKRRRIKAGKSLDQHKNKNKKAEDVSLQSRPASSAVHLTAVAEVFLSSGCNVW